MKHLMIVILLAALLLPLAAIQAQEPSPTPTHLACQEYVEFVMLGLDQFFSFEQNADTRQAENLQVLQGFYEGVADGLDSVTTSQQCYALRDAFVAFIVSRAGEYKMRYLSRMAAQALAEELDALGAFDEPQATPTPVGPSG